MSTRSVVARQRGDGFKGRYVHLDGYPSGVGARLYELCNALGAEQTLKVLTEDHYGWSSIHQSDQLNSGYHDARFELVDGIGIAYTTVNNQSSPGEWITHDGDGWGTEYAYVIAPDAGTMSVFSRLGESWRLLVVVRLDQPEPDWSEIESREEALA